MSKRKPRTPPPPRPQAPQRRDGKSKSKSVPRIGPLVGGRSRRFMYGMAGGAVALIAIVVVVVAVAGGGGGGGGDNVATLMSAAGCTYRTVNGYVPKGGSTHVPSLTKTLPWNTDPPSNGQHYPLWAVWGFYREPINPRKVVHNEEHGGIILWWGNKVPAATVDKLSALYQEAPVGMFGTPYAKLGSKVAITAWTGNPATYTRNGDYGKGHIATCPTYTDKTAKAFRAFRDAFVGKGPEGIPLSSDQPGLGP